jgi:DNA polymerase III alpha subunit
MITDKYGQQIFTEQDLCDLYMSDPEIKLSNVLVNEPVNFNPNLEINDIPKLVEYTLSDKSIEEFDNDCHNNWFLPNEYKNFDIAQYVLEQCKNDAELQRAGEELLLYQERDMFVLLQYLKYLVDTMRQNNIVWGVGRGSSVSSFVLYLIGIHRINSLYYDLSIDEFLK